MNTKLLLGLALVTALAPLAAAGGAYGGLTSYTYGTCDDPNYGYAVNYASAAVQTGGSYASVGAFTFCQSYYGSHFGQISGGACAQDSNSGTFACAGAGWFEFGSFCDTQVYTIDNVNGYNSQSVGCPAGGPPDVPALLP